MSGASFTGRDCILLKSVTYEQRQYWIDGSKHKLCRITGQINGYSSFFRVSVRLPSFVAFLTSNWRDLIYQSPLAPPRDCCCMKL